MEFSPLTPLEIEIVGCVAQGHMNEIIARRLNLSLPVLQRELTTIYKKLGIVSRLELLLGICSGEVNLGSVNRMAASGGVRSIAVKLTVAESL